MRDSIYYISFKLCGSRCCLLKLDRLMGRAHPMCWGKIPSSEKLRIEELKEAYRILSLNKFNTCICTFFTIYIRYLNLSINWNEFSIKFLTILISLYLILYTLKCILNLQLFFKHAKFCRMIQLKFILLPDCEFLCKFVFLRINNSTSKGYWNNKVASQIYHFFILTMWMINLFF